MTARVRRPVVKGSPRKRPPQLSTIFWTNHISQERALGWDVIPPKTPHRATKKTSAKPRHKKRVLCKDIDVYLGSHVQGAQFKRTKTVRKKLKKLGLADPEYETKVESYKNTIAKTVAITEGLKMKCINLARFIDQSRLKEAGTIACCGDAKGKNVKTNEERITCADPLCDVGVFHASCLTQIDMQNYEVSARLSEKNPLRGKWMCVTCKVIRERGGFPEMRTMVEEIRRAEEAMKHDPVGRMIEGKKWPPVQV